MSDLFHYLVTWCPVEERYAAYLLDGQSEPVYGKTPEFALAACRKALWRELEHTDNDQEPIPFTMGSDEAADICRGALEDTRRGRSDLLGGATIYRCEICEKEFWEGDDDICEHLMDWLMERAAEVDLPHILGD